MSSEALYEKYKDALKRGHVAALRGHVDEALLSYAEAARIAPERSTPHSSAGTALLRRKRPAEALRHYEVALKIAPRDEAALLGRAQALAAMDRRGDAADAFDALAEVQAANGRLADAVDAARRGLEMAEGRERRRTLERLIARLRASEPGEPGRVALERALQVLEGVAVPPAMAAAPKPAPSRAPAPVLTATAAAEAEAAATAAAADVEAIAAEAEPATSEVEAADAAAASGTDEAARPTGTEAEDAAAPAAAERTTDEAETDEVDVESALDEAADSTAAAVVADAEPAEAVEAEPSEPELEPTLPAPRDIPDGVTAAGLAARAEAAVEARVPAQAVDALLDLAAVHAREGRIDAALDACYAAVSFDPDNFALHLALAELYGERGWAPLVTEKLDLLQRLAALDGDHAALADIAGVRAALS